MKKTVLFVLSLMLILSFALPAQAEEAEAGNETMEMTWEDVESYVELLDMEGDIYEYDGLGIQMWIPAGYEQVELTADDLESGYIDYFENETGDSAISMAYFEGLDWDEEQLVEALESAGATNITPIRVNGISGVMYDLEEADTGALDFLWGDGDVLEISFAPVSDGETAAKFLIMTYSIRPLEEETSIPAA